MSRVSFLECLRTAVQTPELVAQFDRLSGTHLSEFSRRSPLDAMVDEATGHDADAMQKFVEFVWEFVWMRLPDDVRRP